MTFDFWPKSKRLAFYGCGNMGSAMLEGWLKAGLEPSSVCLLIQNPEKHQRFANLGVHVVNKSTDLPAQLDVLILAVKPQIMPQIMTDADRIASKNTLVISVAAGLNSNWYAHYLKSKQILRVMPNTPCAQRQGVNGLYANFALNTQQRAMVDGLFGLLGANVWLEREEQMHELTAISGCGPAYVYYFVEALSLAAQKLGFDEQQSLLLAKNTVLGAAALMEHSDLDPSILRQHVTSAKGVTHAGLVQLMEQKQGLSPLLQRVTQAAVARSRALEAEG